MIRTIAELLRTLVEEELPILDSSGITHAPTIGDMYEGLSGELLARAVPSDLGLRVVTGFATDGKRLSGQLDRMLVRGEGEQIPQTTAYTWHVKDIIAVVETKKNLLGSKLREAFDQLATVRQLEVSWREMADAQDLDSPVDVRAALRTFAQMTGRIAPSRLDLADLPAHERMVYHSLITEQLAIVRIVIGFHGYHTEAGFRRGMVSLLKDTTGIRGFGPVGLPQLIISGNYSLVKANGRPYSAPLVAGEWPFMFSTPVNPLVIMLELIWTRLDYLFKIGNPWGDDLEGEVARPLVFGVGDERGWRVHYVEVNEKELGNVPSTEDWQPAYLSEEQFVILNELCAGMGVNLTDASLLSYLSERDVSLESVRDGLLQTRLVAMNGDEFELATVSCQCAILPNGDYVAADNNTGRLTRWIARHFPTRAS
jgi:hypothetical protein